ncbi:MAG: rhodanese-like domain-containing protein [Cyclobacteriaceae bacterium]|nr:rhodanese-like domain-containing protein [Cyclobacteriaceae bacterium]
MEATIRETTNQEVKEITVQELERWKATGHSFQLIDVREPFEHEIANLGGTLIPLGQVPERTHEIDTHRDVIIYCRSGRRSAEAVSLLQRQGMTGLYNLRGGIIAYATEIDDRLNLSF